ncbi:hypothetical protein ACEQ8H_003246 [Pleosporales sp. CAS-2024a]
MSAPHGPRRPRPATRPASPAAAQRLHARVAGLERHVIHVAEPRRVLECAQADRQRAFQRLVRHYLSQTLHGCRSACCTTPTCLSCQRRNAARPLRPPTQLTARALAHYLARQHDPQRGLCSHALKVEPASVEIDGPVGAQLHEALQKRRQMRKDKKSLSQNLYDSVSMIYAYSKQLPSSASLYQALRSPTLSSQHSPSSSNVSSAKSQTGVATTSQRSMLGNGAHAVPPANVTTHDGECSGANGHSRSSPLSPVLSDGQQIHRIPYHIRAPLKSTRPSKAVGPNPVDGASGPPALSTGKTRNKSKSRERSGQTMERKTSSTNATKNSAEPSPDAVRAHAALPVLSNLSCDSLDALKNEVYDHRKDQVPDDFNFSVDYDTNRHFPPSTPFVNRSLYYTLSDAETLLESFRSPSKAFESSPLPHLDSARLAHSFRDWNRHNGALVFDSLCLVLKALFTPPPEILAQKSPRLAPSHKGTGNDSPSGPPKNMQTASAQQRYLDNAEAAHIVMICIHALTSSVFVAWPHTWEQLRKLRSWGIVLPNSAPQNDNSYMHPFLNIIDDLEYEPAIRLAEHLLRAIGARTCFERIISTMSQWQDGQENNVTSVSLVDYIVQHLVVVERVALATKRHLTPNGRPAEDPGWTVTSVLVERLKTVITKRWDGKVEINKWSSVGSAVMLLQKLSDSGSSLNVLPLMFKIPFFNQRFNAVEEPVKYLEWEEQPNTLHILQYPDLFPEHYLVRYFRTINFTSMLTQYDHTTRTNQLRGLLQKFLRDSHMWLIRYRMDVTLTDYLVLNVRREEPLKDTLDQLWGLEKRMLLKPLKVQMGSGEGELGADHGGVTYEFFRVVLSEAFQPDHGMFTLDTRTRMTWFQPGSLEPEWKFEMIGIIFSLAIYNGITLPVTLPLVLYHFLLQPEPPLHYSNMSDAFRLIQDGWPDLAKQFEQLLQFDGDVAEVYMREYAFSYEAYGQNIAHNMDEPFPSSSSMMAGTDVPPTWTGFDLVTNENRGRFVWQYLEHLTYLSVRPQLEAFQRGFMTCLHAKSLGFFTPAALRRLIEGEHDIDVLELKRVTRYEDGYSATHATIVTFWRLVEQYSQEDCRHLLEFVTASDRVPVTGYESITFHIKKVSNRELLPTSSTCFGKLYLPAYADEETMRKKLLLAIRNSKGFGVV